MPWITPHPDRKSLTGTLPGIATAYDRLYARLWQLPQLPPTTLELCRLRLAQLHRSDLDWQRAEQPVAEDKRRALSAWHRSPAFSDAERACLALTEVYAMDAQSVGDEHAEAVKQHYGDAGLVALIEALGIFDGATRLSLLWQLARGNDNS